MSAGRPFGAKGKNKSLLLAQLTKLAKQRPKGEPIEFMWNLIANDRAEKGLRLAAAKEVAQYMYPKLRSIELTGDENKPIVVKAPEERQRRIDALLQKRVGPEPLAIVDPE